LPGLSGNILGEQNNWHYNGTKNVFTYLIIHRLERLRMQIVS
jgi:hypothetical protein